MPKENVLENQRHDSPQVFARSVASATCAMARSSHEVDASPIAAFAPRFRPAVVPRTPTLAQPVEVPDPAQPVWVRALGRFRLEVDHEALHFDCRAPRRVLELLKCIIALGADGVSCDAVAAALWPDAEGDAARKALEIALHRLRKLLGNKQAVQVSHGVMWLETSVVWVDVAAFEALADRANGEHGAVHVDIARRALALYRGPFLQNDSETAWLLPRRHRLRSRHVRLATRTAQHYEEAGDLAQAADFYATALEIEPLLENLHRRLMLCLARQGCRADAIVAYQRLRQLLEVVLRTVPSQETEAAYAAIVHGA